MMFRHKTPKKIVINTKGQECQCGDVAVQVELTTVSVLYGGMLDIWPIIEHSQVSFVNFTRKHVHMIFFR